MNNQQRPPPPPPGPGGPMRQGPPQGMPPQGMPQQQNFQQPIMQQRIPEAHQVQDIIINASSRIHRIPPVNDYGNGTPQSEKDIRKSLTTYEAYTILPNGDLPSPSKTASTSSKKSASDKKPIKKERWAEARINTESFAQEDMAKRIKKLDEKDSVTDKMRKLFPNQHSQVTNVLDCKVGRELDPAFEWTLAQLDQDFFPTNPKTGKKQTKSITLYLKRAPKIDTDVREVLRRREAHKQMQAREAAHQRMMHEREQQRMMQQAAQNQQMQHEQQQRMMQQQQQQQQQQAMGQGRPGMPQGGGPNGIQRIQTGPGGHVPAGVQVLNRGRGGGGGGGRRRSASNSTSSSSSSSSSGSDSDDVYDSDTTPESVSTGSSDRRRRGKKYNRPRSRSRHSKHRGQDLLMINGAGRRNGPPLAPGYPRGRDVGRTQVYGRAPAVAQGAYQQGFFDVNQGPHAYQPGSPVLHQAQPRAGSDVSSANMNAVIAAAVQAGVAAGANARPAPVMSGALTVRQPQVDYEPLISRPPVGARVLDRLEAAEERFREDEIRKEVEFAIRRREDRERPLPRRRDSGFYEREREYEDAPRYRARPLSPTRSDNSTDSYYARSRDGYPRPRADDFDRRGRADDDWDFVGRSEAFPQGHPFAPRRPNLGRSGTARW